MIAGDRPFGAYRYRPTLNALHQEYARISKSTPIDKTYFVSPDPEPGRSFPSLIPGSSPTSIITVCA